MRTRPSPIHTFAASSARADRIDELLRGRTGLTAVDFEAMQADRKDLRTIALVPEFLPFLEDTGDRKLDILHDALAAWDGHADPDSAAAAICYTFLDRAWHCRFLVDTLGSDFAAQPYVAPMLSRIEPSRYPAPTWDADAVGNTIRDVFREVFDALERELGEPSRWSYGAIHQIQFWHTLRKRAPWEAMQVGPAPVGGSATTLAMAMHMGPGPGTDAGPGKVPQRVWHGPAYRLVVDLADPDHCRFVIASGNSGPAGQPARHRPLRDVARGAPSHRPPAARGPRHRGDLADRPRGVRASLGSARSRAASQARTTLARLPTGWYD